MKITTHNTEDKKIVVTFEGQFMINLDVSEAKRLRDMLSNSIDAEQRARDEKPVRKLGPIKVGESVAVSLYGVRVATGTYTSSPWTFNHGVIVDESTPIDSMEQTISALDKANDEGPTRIDTTTYGGRKVIFAPKFEIVRL